MHSNYGVLPDPVYATFQAEPFAKEMNLFTDAGKMASMEKKLASAAQSVCWAGQTCKEMWDEFSAKFVTSQNCLLLW